MVKINPALMFSGACGDAFRRYAALFGGDIVYMLTYAESPLAGEVPPDWRDKVWFARLRAGGLDVAGGDVLPQDYEAPQVVSKGRSKVGMKILVAHIFTSWNQMADWIRELQCLSKAA